MPLKYSGLYSAVAVSNADPLKVGRVKVRVLVLHGFIGNPAGIVPDADLPWALPRALPAGGTPESGGISWIPVVGDQLWVTFLDGDLDKPVWEWGNQNQTQAAGFHPPLHAYTGENATRRAALMRFGHWLTVLPVGHDQWTKSNHHFTITDATGEFKWRPESGAFLLLNNAKLLAASVDNVSVVATKDSSFKSATWETVCSTSWAVAAPTASITSSTSISLSAPSISFSGKDGKAADRLVRLSDLLKAFEQLKEIYDNHTHGGSRTPDQKLVETLTASALVGMEGETSTSVQLG
jgi:hypothetical protein